MTDKLKVIGCLLGIVAAFFSAYFFIDNTYAPKAIADSVEQNAVQIRIIRLEEAIRWYNDQMAFILQHCSWDLARASPEARTQYYNYQNLKISAEQELQALRGIR